MYTEAQMYESMGPVVFWTGLVAFVVIYVTISEIVYRRRAALEAKSRRRKRIVRDAIIENRYNEYRRLMGDREHLCAAPEDDSSAENENETE